MSLVSKALRIVGFTFLYFIILPTHMIAEGLALTSDFLDHMNEIYNET